jgi:hypothetical protein
MGTLCVRKAEGYCSARAYRTWNQTNKSIAMDKDFDLIDFSLSKWYGLLCSLSVLPQTSVCKHRIA